MSNKETIDEAAERYAEGKSSNFTFRTTHIRDFSAGAKWQAKTMYSEEEMIIIMDSYADDVMGGCNLRAKEWFEQLNKKNNEQ
jgi:hypothetical protein